MPLERYNYLIAKSFQEYRFYSRGRSGKISKIVSFTLHHLEGKTFLSLTFGDYVNATGEIDMLSVSDNGDTEKVLSTVFTILVDFLSRFPDMLIYTIGSNRARTRLYQMSINRYRKDIESVLVVYGFRNDKWELFEKNNRYDAFIFGKKL